MLAFILAIAVGIASVFFFFSAFFAPKIHRKDDFLWSGVGLFYAATLWICAQRITGSVLLSQIAAVALVLSFAWQTVKLRAALANPEKIAEHPDFSLLDWLGGGLSRKKVPPKSKGSVKPKASQETSTPSLTLEPIPEKVIAKTVAQTQGVEEEAIAPIIAEKREVVVQEEVAETDITSVSAVEIPTSVEPSEETLPPSPDLTVGAASPLTQSSNTNASPLAKPSKKAVKPTKPNFFSRLFGKKSPPVPAQKSATITEALDAAELESDWEEELETQIAPPEVLVESVTLELTETVTLETPLAEAEGEEELEDFLEESEDNPPEDLENLLEEPEDNPQEDLENLLEEPEDNPQEDLEDLLEESGDNPQEALEDLLEKSEDNPEEALEDLMEEPETSENNPLEDLLEEPETLESSILEDLDELVEEPETSEAKTEGQVGFHQGAS